ncbi:MAG: class V aminotransferase [Candidatus Gottesmanbacteria bacterium GW2011_GWA2_43_14]|uniref:Class V aminotransferase n=1 Tax=Candidatus Gottesmanbacteria bacterium GW2011_GWA2_43_14 TaxID=1618443 RepID=A0A0G1DI99_9BACT|nr:MAG: class V aminotransferase [Candidatus Gottesmanbacteria bacterium GW2011_GWA2_43_14]
MKGKTPNLRIPGPTPLSPDVIKASSRQMISHRGREYEEMQKRVTGNLLYFFQTKNDLFLLTSSGMGGLEAAVVNFFSPSDKLIFFTVGEFGNRWAEIAKRYQAKLIRVKFPAGKSCEKEEVIRVLSENKDAAGVFITHNETSSGVLNDVEAISPLVRQHPNKPLFLVDSISSMGAVNLPVDDWGIDVAVSASQKAWMSPPGLSFISVSARAWERYGKALMPKYYFDLNMYRDFAAKNQTPATPAVGVLFGLDCALENMRKTGREKIFKKHLQMRDYLRAELRKIGLQLFVSDSEASPTVTSIVIPRDIDYHRWLEFLREKYNVILAGGMGETKGRIIRVAHMGMVEKENLNEVVDALEKSLKKM